MLDILRFNVGNPSSSIGGRGHAAVLALSFHGTELRAYQWTQYVVLLALLFAMRGSFRVTDRWFVTLRGRSVMFFTLALAGLAGPFVTLHNGSTQMTGLDVLALRSVPAVVFVATALGCLGLICSLAALAGWARIPLISVTATSVTLAIVIWLWLGTLRDAAGYLAAALVMCQLAGVVSAAYNGLRRFVLCVAFGGASLFLLASTAYAQLLALRGTGSALGWGVWYIGISVVTAVGLNFWERVPPEVRFDLEGTPEEDRQVREAAEVIELLRAISFSWSTTPATSS